MKGLLLLRSSTLPMAYIFPSGVGCSMIWLGYKSGFWPQSEAAFQSDGLQEGGSRCLIGQFQGLQKDSLAFP